MAAKANRFHPSRPNVDFLSPKPGFNCDPSQHYLPDLLLSRENRASGTATFSLDTRSRYSDPRSLAAEFEVDPIRNGSTLGHVLVLPSTSAHSSEMTAERAREREVQRYYQAWLESSVGYKASEVQITSTRFHADGSRLKASKDKGLTSFAQLGCLRLDAKRGIVTLIASVRQYILAEATKTLSLLSDDADDSDEDELWFGNASFARAEGISEYALDPEDYTAYGPNGTTRTAPAFVVNDITLDERFSGRGYAGKGVTFYCGVPITSKAGFSIGAYTITDDKPRDGLSPKELKFMQDMASTVIQYLDTVRGEAARFRGERMVLGLSSFIEGRSSAGDGSKGGAPDHLDRESGDQPSIALDYTRSHRGMNATDADPGILRSSESSRQSTTTKGVVSFATEEGQEAGGTPISAAKDKADANDAHAKPLGNHGSEKPSNQLVLEGPIAEDSRKKGMAAEIDRVFWRAANILRQCAAADGVVFYDAISTNLAKRPDTSEFSRARHRSNGELGWGASPECSDNSSNSNNSTSVSSGMSDEDTPYVLSSKSKICQILGYSMDISNQSTATSNTINSLELKEQSLRRFIRRYPKGKMFYFNEMGEVTSSEGELTLAGPGTMSQTSRRRSKIAIAQELIRIVPGARNAIWLPLWDFSKQRWCAGAFLWSRRAEQLIAAQDDLSYLRTFGQSIMHELERLDAIVGDQAKSTFIANISHELRSPLHGILGSIEFLQETEIDTFQSSMITAVETCGKTLLDTMEHVLDYAKVNHLSKKASNRRTGKKGSANQDRIDADLYNTHTLEDDVNIATIVEEVVEAVYAGQTFRHPEISHGQESPFTHAKNFPNPSSDVIQANVQRGPNKFSGAVTLVLDIECDKSWWVNVQPGAIRRVLMNLLGNALKYTDQGLVSVSLTGSKISPKESLNRTICLSVKDTGIGMSAEFLHNHAFTPFTQESQFSAGTGLGLSIVRQIVNSLGGKIEMQSQKGVGTDVKVWLALPTAPPPSSHNNSNDDTLQKMIRRTPGLTICLLEPTAHDAKPTEQNVRHGNSGESLEKALIQLAESWFGMKTIRSKKMDGVSADFFVHVEPPPIEYLLKDHGEYSRNAEVPLIIMATNAFESASLTAKCISQLTDQGRNLEIISQPCGPNKFAKALYRCLARRKKVVDNPDRPLNELASPGVKDKPPNQSPHADTDDEPQSHGDGQTNDRPNRRRSNDELIKMARLHLKSSSEELEKMKPASEEDSSKIESATEDGSKTEPATEEEAQASNTDPLSRTESPKPIRKPKSLRRRSTTRTSSANTSDIETPSITSEDRPPILLVDDNEINLNLLKAFMRRAKRRYEAVHNGLEAVQAYERASKDPDTAFTHVLMDLSMPVMDGITATREIRDLEKISKLKRPAVVVALTALTSETTQREMFQAGGNYFLPKPIKFRELIKLLD